MSTILADKLSCPNCHQLIRPKSRFCPHCHCDMAKDLVDAELALVETPLTDCETPLTPEALVPYIGDYLVANNYIEAKQLEHALICQRHLAAKGEHKLVGQILIDMGMIERDQLDRVVAQQMLAARQLLSDENEALRTQMQMRTKELYAAFAQLAELSRLKSNFIAAVSHELTTPLLHLTSYLELLAQGHLGPLTTAQLQALTSSQRTTQRLQHLIDDLLQFSATSQGDYPLHFSEISLDTPLLTAVSKSLTKAKARQVALNTHFTNNIPHVEADGQKITWVLEQLLDNAIKFTQPGGMVEISAELQADNVYVSIKDNGIGIDPQQIEDIFEPFRQLNQAPMQRIPGTGLGLALAKHIIEAHGSNLTVQSKQREGTSISFTLPAIAK